MEDGQRKQLVRYLIGCVEEYVRTAGIQTIKCEDILIVTGLLSHVLVQSYIETVKETKRDVSN